MKQQNLLGREKESVTTSPLRLLYLEANSDDAALVRQALMAEWPDSQLVQVEEKTSFMAAFLAGKFDVILADYCLPSLDGLAALALARERAPQVPFVFFSAGIGEDVAVESLKAGATDYVLKARPARLIPAIRRALKEAENQTRHRQTEAGRRESEPVKGCEHFVPASICSVEAARRESEALKGAIMEAALDCIIVVDQEGTILEFNPAAEKTFGYARADVLGQPLVEKIVPPKLRGRFEHGLKRYFAARASTAFSRRIEITATRADGSEFPAEFGVVPIRLAGRNVFTAYIRDVTERKHAQEKFTRIQSKLKETNQDLVRRNQEIQNFCHTLSHELKTPLTSAREFVSIVMDGLAGPVNETQLDYLGIARGSCDQLRACINDLLEATRLETGKVALDLKLSALDTLVRREVTALVPLAADKMVALKQDFQAGLREVLLDEHRMTQVITNLLSNAIKYTPSGGEISVKVEQAPGNAEWLQVSVSDTGPGIPKGDREHIFERLYQVKSGDAATEHGVGLGLYLCRELIQLHGGEIWVESEVGQGSTFYFVVPRSPHCLHLNVLVVDDDPEILQMLSTLLRAEEYNVRTASNGLEALDQIQQQVPDLIVLDLVMPEMDGPSTLREIRHRWGTIPVIVSTGYLKSHLVKQALAFCPFTLLAKPYTGDQLLETVRKVQSASDTTAWRRITSACPRSHRNRAGLPESAPQRHLTNN